MQGVGGTQTRSQMSDATLGTGFTYGLDSFSLLHREEAKIDGWQTRLLRCMWKLIAFRMTEGQRVPLLRAGWGEGSVSSWKYQYRIIPSTNRAGENRMDH